MILYETKHRSGYWYEYHLDENKITKYKYYRFNYFDGVETDLREGVEEVESWELGDPSIPSWLVIPTHIDC